MLQVVHQWWGVDGQLASIKKVNWILQPGDLTNFLAETKEYLLGQYIVAAFKASVAHSRLPVGPAQPFNAEYVNSYVNAGPSRSHSCL